ncbi:MAG: terminase small subunit [bacterium]
MIRVKNELLERYIAQSNTTVEILEILSGQMNDIFRQITAGAPAEKTAVVKDLWIKTVDAINDVLLEKGTMSQFKSALDAWGKAQLEAIDLVKPKKKRQYRVRLTKRQKRFIEYCSRGDSAAKAARRAGYSPRTARQIGYENLRKPHITQHIPVELSKLDRS